MKATSLTTTLLAALSLTAFAGSYTVKSGDTLHSISRKHKVSVSKIMSLNKISDPTKLRVGQSLSVSGSSSKKKSSSSSRSSSTSKYKVAKGDTFYSIARRHKISVSKLRALNPSVSSHLISPGQTLAVTGKAAPIVKKIEKKPVTVAKVSQKKVTQKKAERPAPKKISAAITLANKKTTSPAPKEESVAVVLKDESTPISTPPAPPLLDTPPVDSPPAADFPMVDPPSLEAPVPPTITSSVASVILTDQTTFDAFASKHGTDTAQLNALNGWNLPKATVLARGSEIYVPQ